MRFNITIQFGPGPDKGERWEFEVEADNQRSALTKALRRKMVALALMTGTPASFKVEAVL